MMQASENNRRYYEANKAAILERQRKYQKGKRQLNTQYATAVRVRNRLYKYAFVRVSKSLIAEVGCTADTLRTHIEGQFEGGMGWSNYGILWEFDHIRPLSWFNLTNGVPLAATHYTNLRPRLITENRGDKARRPNS